MGLKAEQRKRWERPRASKSLTAPRLYANIGQQSLWKEEDEMQTGSRLNIDLRGVLFPKFDTPQSIAL